MSDGWIRLNFSSTKLDALREQLTAKATRQQEVLYMKVQALTFILQTKVIGKLSNDVLHVRTGVLRGSVDANTTMDGSKITGTISSSAGPAFYGILHEFGVPHAWEVVGTRSKALRFQMSVKENAKSVFAKAVTHPPLPERSFMRISLDETRDEIIRALRQAFADVLREK
jgi:hypothetical protein